MLKTAFALLPALQLGTKLKETISSAVRQAIVAAIAIVLLLFAAAFGLVAGYLAMQDHGFTPIQAAGIIASALLLLGLLTLALLPLYGPRKPKKKSFDTGRMAGQAVGAVDSQLGQVMRNVSPIGVLAAAFVLGIFASRR